MCMKSNVRWNPITNSQKCSLPSLSSSSFRTSWDTSSRNAEKSEQDAADDDVMEMRDHEVRAAKLPVEGCGGHHDSGQACNQELKQKAVQNSMGVLNWILPPHIVASQLNILMPVGTAIAIVVEDEKRVGWTHADRKHVVRPDADADERDTDGRSHHHRVAEDCLARKHGDDLGHEPKAGMAST